MFSHFPRSKESLCSSSTHSVIPYHGTECLACNFTLFFSMDAFKLLVCFSSLFYISCAFVYLDIFLVDHAFVVWGSIGCVLAMKIGGETKEHEISKTQKWFLHILPSLGHIKIINNFNGVPKSKLKKNKILIGINIKLGQKGPKLMDQAKYNLSH